MSRCCLWQCQKEMIMDVHLMIKRALLLLMLLLPAMMASAGDSSVYLTNSTLNTLTIEIEQTGANLEKGEHWQQLVTEIPPLETREVLRFSRYSGLKSGKDYLFNTFVLGAETPIVLQQKVRGTWYGSKMWLSAEGDSFSPGWFYDRDKHVYDQVFDGNATQVAFKSEYTGEYDDIRYVVHNTPEQATTGAPNQFSVLSYNVWATTIMGSKDIGNRFDELPAQLKGYDAIVFSELIDNIPAQNLLDAIRDDYPYQTAVLNKLGYLVNGGVAIVSKWPILEEDKVIYDGVCVDIQCMAARGAAYARINKQGNLYHVIGTHTQSYNEAPQRAARLEQIRLMGEFVAGKNIPADEPVLMAGDFNVNKLLYPEDLDAMLVNLNAIEPENQGNPYTYHGDQNHWADAGWVEYLDYVLLGASNLQPVESVNTVITPRSISDKLWGKWDLSDHFAVVGEFTFATSAVSADIAFPYLGSQVRLETHNGHFMRAMLGGGSFLSAGSSKNGTWESFTLEQVAGNKVALKGYNGRYVSLDSDLLGTLTVNATDVSVDEIFELVLLGDDRVALKAANGKYLKADFGGGAGLTASASEIDTWETFTLKLQ